MNASTEMSSAPTLKRDFKLWNAFALGFAFISPIAALYIILGPGLETVGGGFWWGFPITLVGQTIVVFCYASLARHWPLEGTSYQWSRRLVNSHYGFLHGWLYAIAMSVAISTVAYQTAYFTLLLFDRDTSSVAPTIILALIYIGLVTIANMIGRGLLKLFITICLWAEVVGSLGLGTVLLLFYRQNDFSIVFDGLDFTFDGWTSVMYAPIVLATAFAAWGLVGMDGVASIAEEVENPRRNVPRAMIASIIVVGVTIAYAALAIILAIPDMSQIGSAEVDSPITWILRHYWPEWVVDGFIIIFILAFVTCMLTIQTVASRILWAYARDGDLPWSEKLLKLSPKAKMPTNAILVIGAISAFFYIFSGSNIYTLLINLATTGYYVCFMFPILGMLIARARGTWPPADEAYRRTLLIANWLAFAWLAAMIVILGWPRPLPGDPWYLTWGPVVSIVGVFVIGAVLRFLMVKKEVGEEDVRESEEDVLPK